MLRELDGSHSRAVMNAVMAVSCCSGAGCRIGAPRIRWWKGAFGSQLNTILAVAISSLLNGTAFSTSRTSLVPFEQDRRRPQPYVDRKRCRTVPSLAADCLFEPVKQACRHRAAAAGTVEGQVAAAAFLRSAHPYLVASATSRLLFAPNAWLAPRVAILARKLNVSWGEARADRPHASSGREASQGTAFALQPEGAGYRVQPEGAGYRVQPEGAGYRVQPESSWAPHIAVHIRRGDKLTAQGKEAISMPPTSAIAQRIRALADMHRLSTSPLRTVLVMSDDADVPRDLAAELPANMQVVGLEIPRMENATFGSGRHVAVTVRPGTSTSVVAHQAGQPCGLPSYAGRPALPRCVTGASGEPRATIIDLPFTFATEGAPTSSDDLGAMLHAALWVMASAHVVMASSASNMGALLFTLAGSVSRSSWGTTPILVDNEEKAKLRLQMSDLAAGRYYCRQDWGTRRYGLCTAGQQGRPAKVW